MSINPTSHFVTLPNRPIVQENGEIIQAPLQLHYWQWKGHQPTILLAHGATFHGRCYDHIIEEALSGFHVIALDIRGHGQSQKHPLPYLVRWFGEDILQFIEILNLSKTNLIGIGHSLSGHSLIFASAIASRKLFRSLLLFDPAIYSPSIYEMGDQISQDHQLIIRRKQQWLSIEDMIYDAKKRGRLSRWSEDILRNYCTYALDENFKLQCTPELEFDIYRRSIQSDANIYPIIKSSKFIHQIPVHIVRSSTSLKAGNFEAPPTAPDLAAWLKYGRDRQLKDVKHLFPMEQPELAIKLVKEFIEEYHNLPSHL